MKYALNWEPVFTRYTDVGKQMVFRVVNSSVRGHYEKVQEHICFLML